jgi:hypothetical protein
MPDRAATAATRACDPSPPAMPMTSAPCATASSASRSRSSPGPSTTVAMPRSPHSCARRNRSAFPPPDFRFMIRTGWRAAVTAGRRLAAESSAAGDRRSAYRADATDSSAKAAARATLQMRMSANIKLVMTRASAAAMIAPAASRTGPRRDTAYQLATTHTTRPRAAISRSRKLRATSTSTSTTAAATHASAPSAASRCTALGLSGRSSSMDTSRLTRGHLPSHPWTPPVAAPGRLERAPLVDSIR